MRLILPLIFLSSFLFSENSIAITTKSNGDVKYKKYSSTDNPISLSIGSELFNDDFIKTGVDGFVKFSYLDDGTTIKIHKNSELYIRGKAEDNIINKRLNISNGVMKLDVSKQKEDEFTVVTPTSVASVKGTSFMLETNIDSGDKFYGFEGTVEVLNKESNQIIKLSRNLKVVSTPDGEINSEIITQSDLDLINQLQSSSDNIEIPQNFDELQEGDEQVQEEDDLKQIKIIVKSADGEEREIIIKYSE